LVESIVSWMEAGRFKECLCLHCSKVVTDLSVCKGYCGDLGCEKLLELNEEERSATERKSLLFKHESSVVQKTAKRRLCAGSRSFLALHNTNSLDLKAFPSTIMVSGDSL
jgi:hypothetical protein